MQTIDLTNPSDNYKIITFPDGEKHLELAPLDRKDGYVNVICRITNGDDLFILMQLNDILSRQCMKVRRLTILYLMGMRCDRLFDLKRPFSLKIIADVINLMDADWVFIVEPHSFQTHRVILNTHGVHFSFERAKTLVEDNPNIALVAPDKGAQERLGNAELDASVVCEKVRDVETGNLLSFKAEAVSDVTDRDLLVVDDLCDGGGTFVGLAPELRKLNPKSLSLIVTHAVQKRGIERVAEVYDKVYITDSYKDWSVEELPKNVVIQKLGVPN